MLLLLFKSIAEELIAVAAALTIISNSLEDICAPQKQRRRSNFVERKDGSTTGSMSLTDDTVSSWSCSTPGSGGK
jgi:hypothetical protein